MDENGSTETMDVDAPALASALTGETAAHPEKAAAAAAAVATAEGTNGSSAAASGDAAAEGSSGSDSDDDTEATGGGGGGGDGGTAAATKNSKTPEEKLIKAMGYKDKGNVCIAASDSAGAAKHYERGIKIVSTLGTDEQAKALLLSLRLNLALACTKEERYFDAASAATKVLEVDAANVKALFRRGVARARLGSLEDAKSDLLAVVKADPRNGGAKKELKAVRDRLVEHRKKEKESYGGLFDKGPMYNDKEVERKKREAEALKRQKEEEEQWGKANEQRKADGKEEQTLEDWRKEKKEAEEKAKKEREEKERLKPRPPAIPVAPPKKASKKEGGGGTATTRWSWTRTT